MTTSARSRRIDVRVTDEQDALIRQAAALSGRTVTGFLLDAAEERARQLTDERRHVTMSERMFARFAATLEDPGEVVPELRELFELPRLTRG
jgi:uncharacterized protein (DUF1778 family)